MPLTCASTTREDWASSDPQTRSAISRRVITRPRDARSTRRICRSRGVRPSPGPSRINDAKTGALNILGINAAIASYKDQEFQDFTIRKNRESLDIVEGLFDELGHRYVKSHANFTFVYTGRDIQDVNREFRDENLMVGRPFPPMTDWMRVSMAKPDEMEYFAQVYRKILG